jgi:hypothetical protein
MICRNGKCPWNYDKQCGNPLPVINEAAMCDVIFRPDGRPRHVDEEGIKKIGKEIELVLDGELVTEKEVEVHVEFGDLGSSDSGNSSTDLSDVSELSENEG